MEDGQSEVKGEAAGRMLRSTPGNRIYIHLDLAGLLALPPLGHTK